MLNIKYQEIEIKKQSQVTFLTPGLRRIVWNPLIQPHFDYACIAWYPKLNVKLKILKNKCIRVSLKLDKMHHSSEEDFKTIDWLPVDQRVYANNVCPYYMKEVFEHASQIRISSRNNYARDLKFLSKTLT